MSKTGKFFVSLLVILFSLSLVLGVVFLFKKGEDDNKKKLDALAFELNINIETLEKYKKDLELNGFELQESKTTIEYYKTENQKLKDVIVVHESTIEGKNKIITEKEKEIVEKNNVIVEIQERVVVLEEKSEENESEILRLNAQINSLNTEIESLNSEIARLKNDISLLNSQISDLENELEEKNQKIVELISRIEELENENAQIKININILNETIVELQIKIGALNDALNKDSSKTYLDDIYDFDSLLNPNSENKKFYFYEVSEDYAIASYSFYGYGISGKTYLMNLHDYSLTFLSDMPVDSFLKVTDYKFLMSGSGSYGFMFFNLLDKSFLDLNSDYKYNNFDVQRRSYKLKNGNIILWGDYSYFIFDINENVLKDVNCSPIEFITTDSCVAAEKSNGDIVLSSGQYNVMYYDMVNNTLSLSYDGDVPFISWYGLTFDNCKVGFITDNLLIGCSVQSFENEFTEFYDTESSHVFVFDFSTNNYISVFGGSYETNGYYFYWSELKFEILNDDYVVVRDSSDSVIYYIISENKFVKELPINVSLKNITFDFNLYSWVNFNDSISTNSFYLEKVSDSLYYRSKFINPDESLNIYCDDFSHACRFLYYSNGRLHELTSIEYYGTQISYIFNFTEDLSSAVYMKDGYRCFDILVSYDCYTPLDSGSIAFN